MTYYLPVSYLTYANATLESFFYAALSIHYSTCAAAVLEIGTIISFCVATVALHLSPNLDFPRHKPLDTEFLSVHAFTLSLLRDGKHQPTTPIDIIASHGTIILER